MDVCCWQPFKFQNRRLSDLIKRGLIWFLSLLNTLTKIHLTNVKKYIKLFRNGWYLEETTRRQLYGFSESQCFSCEEFHSYFLLNISSNLIWSWHCRFFTPIKTSTPKQFWMFFGSATFWINQTIKNVIFPIHIYLFMYF